jgi:hypothetical protein
MKPIQSLKPTHLIEALMVLAMAGLLATLSLPGLLPS